MATVEEFALESARRYLQSVVFVDDEIYANEPGKVSINTNIPSSMEIFKPKKATAAPEAKVRAKPEPETEPKTDAQPTSESGSPHYHPKQLVESFARERIVCALYEPEKGFSNDPDSEIFRLCERADVVIFDWDLYKDDGENVLNLISALVTQSQTTVPHHVRLCAIYTTNPDLERVASRLYERLQGSGLETEVLDRTRLEAGSSRIVVLGKPTVGRTPEQSAQAEVAEVDLAGRIITEFAAMHEGILPSIALHSLAAVRSSSKKILDKFKAQMDGAFLVHRALILPDENAFDQLPELLAEEALAVMTDNSVSNDKLDLLVTEVISNTQIEIAWQTKDDRPNLNVGEIAKRILLNGPTSVEEDFDFETKKLKKIAKIHTALGDSSAHLELASLYNVRTKYTENRNLCFGAIIRRQVTPPSYEYSICLMPLCDGVRLSNNADISYKFPFWRLTTNPSPQSRAFAVKTPEQSFLELYASGKPRDRIWLGSFIACERGTVEATLDGDKHVFSGEEGEFEWVAQLKPHHAQRIAQDVGASFSRVGLIEAEWLRLKSGG